MKKLLLFTILTFVLASSVHAADENKAEKAENNVDVKCTDVNKAKACPAQYQKGYKGGYDKTKKYEKLIGRLKQIREIAAKENATQTVEALDKLIAGKQTHLDKKNNELSKVEGCSLDCVKPCCAAKKKSGTCPMTEAKKTCLMTEAKKTCPITEAQKTSSDK